MEAQIFSLAQGICLVDVLGPCHLCGSLSDSLGASQSPWGGLPLANAFPFFSVLYLALNRGTVSCWNHHTHLIPILFSVRFRQRAARIVDPLRSRKLPTCSFSWLELCKDILGHVWRRWVSHQETCSSTYWTITDMLYQGCKFQARVERWLE